MTEQNDSFLALKCGVRDCSRRADYYPVVELTASNGRLVRCVVGAPTCTVCKGTIHSLDRVLGEGGGKRFFLHMQRAFQSGYGSVAQARQPPVTLVARRLAWCGIASEEAEEFRKMRADRDDPPDGSVAIGGPKEVHH